MTLERFTDAHGIAPDIRSYLYADAFLRADPRQVRAPFPKTPFWYREPGLYVPLSCTIIPVAGNHVGSSDTTNASINIGDTSGASLVVVTVASYVPNDDGTTAPTDNKSNTYTAGPSIGTTVRSKVWYAANASVGANHTVSFSKAGSLPALAVMAYSGVVTSTPLDQQNGAKTDAGATQQPGSVTPTETLELVYIGAGCGGVNTFSIDGGFTVQTQVSGNGSTCFGALSADLVQTSIAAANPTVTVSTSDFLSVVIATFKAVGGVSGGGGSGFPNLLYSQQRRRHA